jgi:POT family proton-dependent oligopeptide transporter
MKMAIGCFGCALSYLIMAFAARGGEGVHASWLWLTAYFVVITISELYISPTGLSLVTKIAPERYLSFLMGVWLATSFAGNFLSGWLGTFWSSMAKADFFLLIAAIAAGAGAAIVIVNAPLARAINETPHSTARGQA